MLIVAFGGSGLIAAAGALLRKIFQGVNAEWFVFGSVFFCSLFVFVAALVGMGKIKKSPAADLLKIDSINETMKLGALWTVSTDIYYNLTIELREIIDDNNVTIDLYSHSIQYVGANVTRSAHNLGMGAGRYILPRASVGYGDDCISHWAMDDSSFRGFYVYLIHANNFAHEATIGVFAIEAYHPKPEGTAKNY